MGQRDANQSRPLEMTPEKRDRLRVVYNKAVESGDEEFDFDGVRLVTGYAKYLLEYLDNTFPVASH